MSRRRKGSASNDSISDTGGTGGGTAERPGFLKRKLVSTLLMLLATAILLTLLFPPFYCFFFAPVALVPFCLCILRRPLSKRYLLAYYGLGVAFFAPNLFWLGPVTVGGLIGLSLFVALYFPLFAFGVHRLVVQMRLPATIAVPVVWTAVEYLRSTFVQGGFPWFMLGNCLAPVPLLIQAADLVGVWGLTFLIALLNGLVVDLFRLPLRVRGAAKGPNGPKFSPLLGRLIAAVSLITAAYLAYGVFRLGEQATHPGPCVAVIQENIPQSLKDSDADATLLSYFTLSEKAATDAPKPDLVAWPETMVTAFLNPDRVSGPVTGFKEDKFKGPNGLSAILKQITDDKTSQLAEAAKVANPDLRKEMEDYAKSIAWQTRDVLVYRALEEQAQRNQVPLLVGYSSVDFDPNVIQNRTLLLTPGGLEPNQEYAKRHLVPFGEFTPFHDVPLIGSFMSLFSPMPPDFNNLPGKAWTRFRLTVSSRSTDPAATQIFSSTRFYKFATPICFEDTMPEPARQMSAAQYDGGRKVDFLVNVSNDGWFQSVELDQHLQACQLRAVENRVPIARSVNTGNSGFIDSCGRIVKLVRDGQGNSIGAVGTASWVIQIDTRETFFSRIGDLFPIICGVLSTLLVGWTLVRPRRGATPATSAAPEPA